MQHKDLIVDNFNATFAIKERAYGQNLNRDTGANRQ